MDDAIFVTDEMGRVAVATAVLTNVPGKRNRRNQRIAARMGKPGDEGGLLIPSRYGGSGELINHVPQSRNANRSSIKRIENEMGKALKQGKRVEYTVMPHYPNQKTRRPDHFEIRYKMNGIEKQGEFLMTERPNFSAEMQELGQIIVSYLPDAWEKTYFMFEDYGRGDCGIDSYCVVNGQRVPVEISSEDFDAMVTLFFTIQKKCIDKWKIANYELANEEQIKINMTFKY